MPAAIGADLLSGRVATNERQKRRVVSLPFVRHPRNAQEAYLDVTLTRHPVPDERGGAQMPLKSELEAWRTAFIERIWVQRACFRLDLLDI